MCTGDGDGLVVVVEDDDEIREILCDLLSSAGFTVFPCCDATQGLKAVRLLHPSAVTLDLTLPEMDGIEVLDQLATDERTAAVPVVVISTYSSDRHLRSRPQVRDVVQKPFDADVLCRKVRQAVRNQTV